MDLETLRHSCSHIMASAVKKLYPQAKLGIGPAIENGFYYDFEIPETITKEDLGKIEAAMRDIIKENSSFVKEELPKPQALELFENLGEKYKLELIKELPGETVTIYKQADFVDLCRGPHIESTAQARYFKLLSVSGAYWKGDEKRAQLIRIYGTAFANKQDLAEYLKRLEEAKKRDHRELGTSLKLFTVLPNQAGAGFIYWMPKGTVVRQVIEDYLKKYLTKRGYQFVSTPHVARLDLWKTSGHLDYYQENMYPAMKMENQDFQLKPMNCPGHILIYKTALHSYRELPIRYAEFGTVYRFERSGVLHGLMRVRGFTQDDAHIFCKPDQVEDEVAENLRIITDVLKTFGFSDYDIKLSTRPDKYSGTIEDWERAQEALKKALEKVGLNYSIDPGEGVFYGPKIDLKIKDCLGRAWQCSTVQVDFNNPARFDITYRDESGKDAQVFMIHRALLGSLERFFGVLIEHYAGKFPLWLAPVQASALSIGDETKEYTEQIKDKLLEAGFRVEADIRDESLPKKIREKELLKIPYMLILGKKELAEKKVSWRRQGTKNMGSGSLEEFIKILRESMK